MSKIEDYIPIVGESTIHELYPLADRLRGKPVQNINSTAVGGGVAEILIRMLPLLRDLGLDASWEVIKGNEKFFDITKKMHNALHGVPLAISPQELDYVIEVNRQNAREIKAEAEVMFVHDPQPIALVQEKERLGKKWVWRCHIDFTDPDPGVWEFLKKFIEDYDAAVFSAPAFSRPLTTRQVLISPSIDPLSDKNRELSADEIDHVCQKFRLDQERPIITQISRFDYLKDPVGVIRAYKLVKEHMDCQLVLAGGGATDDPEGLKVLDEVQGEAADDPDIFILFLPPGSDLEINALQRASSVVLQKSLREGFGLTVAEALWKGKPVIASAVGGIPLQVSHKHSGILTHSIEGTAFWIKQLLSTPDYASRLGKNGREHIKANFLITRHIRDYLLLFLSLFEREDIVYL
jgi:trehalose synthase